MPPQDTIPTTEAVHIIEDDWPPPPYKILNGDTLYIPGETGPPPPIDSSYVDSVSREFQGSGTGKGNGIAEDGKGGEGTMPILLTMIAVMFAFVLMRLLEILKQKTKVKRRQVEIKEVLREKGPVYDNWLDKKNPYYSSLSPLERERFLGRTVEFMWNKQFNFHSMEPDEQAAVLISGAAVQLTFGLKNFLIRFFPKINVIKSAYSVVGRDKVLEGHVQVNTQSINISWNNFKQDYEDYTDSENLGLHEMAHAISFDFLYGHHENRNAAFTAKFREYIEEAAPAFKSLREGRNDLLDDYGSLNVEEFWAVSVETFFENAVEFRDKMPGLYAAIAEVLNQDTLSHEKIIDKKLAGLAI